MRVLHFAPRVCWPLDTGAKLRNYHLARVLSERADITLLAFTDAEQSLGELEKFYEQVIAVPRDPGYTLSKIIRGMLGSTPLPVLNYTTGSMKRALESILQYCPGRKHSSDDLSADNHHGSSATFDDLRLAQHRIRTDESI
jgi:hypothetical protein